MQLSFKRYAIQAFLVGTLLGGVVGSFRPASAGHGMVAVYDQAPSVSVHASLFASAAVDSTDPVN